MRPHVTQVKPPVVGLTSALCCDLFSCSLLTRSDVVIGRPTGPRPYDTNLISFGTFRHLDGMITRDLFVFVFDFCFFVLSRKNVVIANCV